MLCLYFCVGFLELAIMKLHFLLFACQYLLINCEKQPLTVEISTQYGRLKGITREFNASIGLGNVSVVNKFLGVPYAAPPTGDLRFRPPQKPDSWDGVYDATKFKPVCYQDPGYNEMFWLKNATWPQSDDCLYLNVYAPNTSTDTLYPVMVYIHGGGYEAGSPVVTPGDILPLWDVVLVTIQYRLGPFGFISTGDSTAPGNYGMLDQIEALKWIKLNIEVFKGNPSNVTIFGESAGGSSVGLLMLSPLSKGLFHATIPISGIDLSPFAVNSHHQAAKITRKTAKKLNCPTHDSRTLINCLRKIKAENLYAVTVSDSNLWRPVVDKIFLYDTPKNLRKAKKFHHVPMLVGITSKEGSFFLQTYYYRHVHFEKFANASFEVYASISITFERPHEPVDFSQAFKEALAFQYTPWPDSNNTLKLKQGLIDIVSDMSFTAPVHAALEEHSLVAPGYLFVFSHQSNLSNLPSWRGATHKDDTPYEFGFPLMDLNVLQEYNEEDKNVSRIIISLMTNFARTHNPTPQPLRGCILPKFIASNHAYININAQPSIEYNFHRNNVAFWNKYFPSLREKSHCENGLSPRGSTSGSTGKRLTLLYDLILLLSLLSTTC